MSMLGLLKGRQRLQPLHSLLSHAAGTPRGRELLFFLSTLSKVLCGWKAAIEALAVQSPSGLCFQTCLNWVLCRPAFLSLMFVFQPERIKAFSHNPLHCGVNNPHEALQAAGAGRVAGILLNCKNKVSTQLLIWHFICNQRALGQACS